MHTICISFLFLVPIDALTLGSVVEHFCVIVILPAGTPTLKAFKVRFGPAQPFVELLAIHDLVSV